MKNCVEEKKTFQDGKYAIEQFITTGSKPFQSPVYYLRASYSSAQRLSRGYNSEARLDNER